MALDEQKPTGRKLGRVVLETGLACEEIANYLAHRLRVAGYRSEGAFGPRAVRCLHRASPGTLRLLNILAHKSLLAVYDEGKHLVRPANVRRAAADTEGATSAGWW